MSLQRIVSILLLFSYGIPAGLGPFWHQHHHGPILGVSCDDDCCRGDIDSALARVRAVVDCREPDGQVCGCAAHGDNPSQVAKQLAPSAAGYSEKETAVAGDCSDELFLLSCGSANFRCQGMCAICAFYAQSQACSMDPVGISSGSLVEWNLVLLASAEAYRASAFSARGPPS